MKSCKGMRSALVLLIALVALGVGGIPAAAGWS